MITHSHHRKPKKNHPWKRLENSFVKSAKKIKELKENYTNKKILQIV